MDLGLKDDVAIITASSSGLGKASAKILAKEGCNVVINGRDKKKLRKTKQEIEDEYGSEVLSINADIKDKKETKRLVSKTIEEFGKLDHVVTSAGGPPSDSFLSIDDEEWYEAFDLLVMSVVRMIREATPHLKKGQGGTIVNIASMSVKEAIRSLVLSNSVRSSVIGLEKTLSKEFAPKIRVNAVLPGPHETSRIEELIEQGIERGEYQTYEQGLRDLSEGIPLGRIGDPVELGELVAFLSSANSSYINGVAIPIDGGRSKSNL